jgi:hypothetical protein
LFRDANGEWFLDVNGNGQWDGTGVDQYISGFRQAGDLPVVAELGDKMEELKTMHTQLIEWAEFVVFVIALARFVGAELVRLLLDLRFFFRGTHRRRNCGTPRPKPRRTEQTCSTKRR